MEEKEFLKLVNNAKYQVFLFASRVPHPLGFALHVWIVVGKKGKIKRWDCGVIRGKRKQGWGYVHIDILDKATTGMNKYPHKAEPRYESKLIGKLEGGQGSIAEQMIKFIEKRAKEYPFRNEYKIYPGPNSNTFVQWILNHFPNSGLKLPWNAFGKDYREIKE